MSKLLVIFGITGQQGGSVANTVLSDPQLSKEFKIRGLTRDVSKPNAQDLAKRGIEMVTTDMDDVQSVNAALAGAHSVFLNITSLPDDEIEQGKRVADACVTAGVSMLIYSGSTHTDQISNGKYKNIASYNCKAIVEDYIRTLPIKSCFYLPGSFMQNFLGPAMGPRPSRDNDGTYAFNFPFPETTALPFIDIATDTGKYVAAILASPGEFEGKDIAAAAGMYSYKEVAQLMTKISGKTVTFNQLPPDVFASFLPAARRTMLLEMFLHLAEFGYYGSETKQLVERDSKLAKGDLVTMEEFLTKNLKLE